LVARGFAYYFKGDEAKADQDFTAAIRRGYQNPEVFEKRGKVRLHRGDLESALEDFNQAIRSDPTNANAYFGRGQLWTKKGEWDSAIADFTNLIERAPKFSEGYRARGWARKCKGNPKGALEDFNRAIVLGPKDGFAVYSRGCLQYDEGNWKAASSDFLRARDLEGSPKDYVEFRLWLSQARLGHREDGTKELTNYLTSRKEALPHDPEAKIGRFLAGQLTEMEFRESLKIDIPNDIKTRRCQAAFYSGCVHLINENTELARKAFTECVESNYKWTFEYESAVMELERLKISK
jgi:tetratricopeptide (TPR) repeat protein